MAETKFDLKEYCEKHPEKVSTRCGIRGKLPCMDEGPHEFPFRCGKNVSKEERCPYIETFSTALDGKTIRYKENKSGNEFCRVVLTQCPEDITVKIDESLFGYSRINLSDITILEVIE